MTGWSSNGARVKKPREQRKEQWTAIMKESLHRAVVKVLAERGFSGLTMERVTREAGIAKGTLYNYFKDKEDLLHYVVESSLQPLEREVDEVLGSDLVPEQKLGEFARRTIRYFDERREFFRVLLDPELAGPGPSPKGRSRHRELIKKVSGVFEAGVRSGSFRRLDPMKLAAMFVMSCGAMMMGRLWMEKLAPVEEDAEVVLRVFFEGVIEGRTGKKK